VQVRAVEDTPERLLRDYTARLQAIVTMRRAYRFMTASLGGLFGVVALLVGLVARSAAGGFALGGGAVFVAALWLGGCLIWRSRPPTERALAASSRPPAARTPGSLRGAFSAAAVLGMLAALVSGLSMLSADPPPPGAVWGVVVIGVGGFVVFGALFVPPGYVYGQTERYFAGWLEQPRNRAAYEAAARRLRPGTAGCT
jgi:hypothetical protein